MGFSTHRKMVLFSGYFGVFLSYLLRALFWVFPRIFTRFLTPEPVNSVPSSTLSYRTESNFSEVGFSNSPGKSEWDSRESDVVVSNDHHKPPESEPKIASSDSEMVDHTDNNVNDKTEDEEENDTPKLVFKFQYQTWKCGEEPNDTHREIHDFTNNPGTETTASASKYEVVSGKSLSHFFEESKVSIFTVEELFAHSNDDDDDGSLEKREVNDSNSKFSSPEFGKDQTEKFNIDNNNSPSDSEEDDVDIEYDDDVGYEAEDFDEEDREVMEELRMIEQECSLASAEGPNCKEEEEMGEKEKEKDEVEEWNNGYDDTLWEHQELIEQLKMELKKVRATGLPTILEDSESPRIMEDLKPWKIDDRLHSNSTSSSNDLPKFYRSYRERMRKFDILNYQKMYAIGLLESKEPLERFWVENKKVVRENKSKKRSCEREANKLMRELYSEVEMVYVGQLCLSWEFLQWEYEKALELWESDPYATKTYNEVAGEFQHFQVLLLRFLENESFQGPRVPNYVRNRLSMRNLLQVPLIREDNAKDKKKPRKRGSDNYDEDGNGIIITSDMLVEILEESIRTIWRFIRADKLASNNLTHTQINQDHVADSVLLHQLTLDLHKKEKRVREALRSGSCILKKFQKRKLREEEATDHQVVYFFAQVDMKLVWRVLNMTRITSDQLAWCRNKLNNIHFVNRTVHVDPTFLLFPC